MKRLLDGRGQPGGDAELRGALEAVLGDHFGGRRPVTGLTRRPSEYRSSFALDELDVRLGDGTALSLVFKDVSWRALLEDARHAKPSFLYDPLREIETYRTVLAPARLGTAVCYGAVVDRRADRYWLFLERVDGLRLCHVGEFAVWREAARWLAGLHEALAPKAEALARARPARWLKHDRAFYRQWLDRARAFAGTGASLPPGEGRRGIDRVARRFDDAVERLLGLPRTLIHGEFYASNVLVQQSGGRTRICPVDWEMAALAPGVTDLAALTCGTWTDKEREELALAYHGALAPGGAGVSGPDALLASLDLGQLCLAVQWLGWSLNWAPPPEQACNWLREALRLTEKLGL